jgi:hypothetical protein
MQIEPTFNWVQPNLYQMQEVAGVKVSLKL